MPVPAPSPITWSVGDAITAAKLNAQVRDAITFLSRPPHFRGRQTSAQAALTNATWTAIVLSVADFDTYGGWSSGTPTRYTSQLAGYYQLSAVVSFPSNATGGRGIVIYKNGVAIKGTSVFIGAANGTVTTVPSATTEEYLGVGDYVEVYGYQTSGAGLATFENQDQCSSLTARFVHA